MSTNQYHCLRELRPGSYDWNIKVRVIRLWRGVSKKGEEFKGLNMLLLDDKNTRMHAFAPAIVIQKHEDKLTLGQICTIQNFSVKDYKSDDKFRCVQNDRQIIFTTYTVVAKKDEDRMILKNLFDFHDLGDLNEIANQNVYLTDIIGVIEKDFPLRNVKTVISDKQMQIKFTIVDGRCSVNVTFWDSLAAEFATCLGQVTEYPPIIIIAGAKITTWQGSNHSIPQVDVSNASATKFYLNYDYHTVSQLRRMLSTPTFSKYDFSSQVPDNFEVLKIEQIKSLGINYAEKEVVCAVRITSVLKFQNWIEYACTSCYKQIEDRDGLFQCYRCNNREVPYPLKRFQVDVEVGDETGNILISLFDRQVRTLIGKNAAQVKDEQQKDNSFPEILNTMMNKCCTVKLRIKSTNIDNTMRSYYTTDISTTNDKHSNESTDVTMDNIQDSATQASGSSFHLDDFSQLNFVTPDNDKKKKKTTKPRKKK